MILSNLLNCCQVDFGSNNSCVNQLILIANNTDGAFDTNPFLEVPGVILDLLKGFGKIWQEGLLFKLKNNGINQNTLQLIKSFLRNRLQRVVLNDHSSSL